MVKLRGVVFVLLLVILVSGCDDTNPLAPTPVVEFVEVAFTVELPYPEDANFNPGISGVTVTCLNGCEDQQVGTTDNLGRVTLTGSTPLTIRAEKSGCLRLTGDSSTNMGMAWAGSVEAACR